MNATSERLEFLGDIITTAVEGGTGYWAQVSQYQWIDTVSSDEEVASYRHKSRVMVSVGKKVGDDARAVLHPLNADESGYEDEGLVLTTDVVEAGIRHILANEIGVRKEIRATIREASECDDAGMLGGDDCDLIVQAGLLGEIRYG